MTTKKPRIVAKGIVEDILKVLTKDKWQSAALIVAQMTFPPDAVSRRMTSQDGRHSSLSGAKTGIMAQRIRHLINRGLVERRRSVNGKYEYRLSSNAGIEASA